MKLFSRKTKAVNTTNDTRSTIASAIKTAVATAVTSTVATLVTDAITNTITDAINSKKVNRETKTYGHVDQASKEIIIDGFPDEDETIHFITKCYIIHEASVWVNGKKCLVIKDSTTDMTGVYPIISIPDKFYGDASVYATRKGVYIKPIARSVNVMREESELVKDDDGVWRINKHKLNETENTDDTLDRDKFIAEAKEEFGIKDRCKDDKDISEIRNQCILR